MSLTRTFTQTHRHYPDDSNMIDVDAARAFGYPLMGMCGKPWIPGEPHETDALPMCPSCELAYQRSIGRDDRATYVYRCFDELGTLIYVGCSVSPRNRMETHRSTTWWWPQVATIRYVVFPSREYALAKEREAITEEGPRFNIKGRWAGRALWSENDYRDYHLALSMTKAGSTKTADHIASVEREALARYGVELAS